VCLIFFVLLLVIHILAIPSATTAELERTDGNKRLIVLVHGLGGYSRFGSAIDLARTSLPGSDLLIFNYGPNATSAWSNASPYEITDVIENKIHEAYSAHGYDEIVLVGHSMGGMLLRKAIVWANGLEQDREHFALRGKREWIKKAERFVSLASINRGWSIHPRPKNMGFLEHLLLRFVLRLAKLSMSAELVFALERGSPFVADARVQWIDLCRGKGSETATVPQTIHLLGDRDVIVTRDDSMDLNAAKDTIFVTLLDTSHYEIGIALDGGTTNEDRERREKVRLAIRGDIGKLEPDKLVKYEEDLSVRRIVYIMHGIRDYGEWGDQLAVNIEAEAEKTDEDIRVVPAKYGHFPMAPFLFFEDRQEHVREFMDEYTEHLARYPHTTAFDYVGHSNGTYILASALQNYKTLKVRRVYFAGSVVPKHYPWRDLADDGRVGLVANVVAADDWVVAIFPRLFEQVADWRGDKPVRGFLDIGSAGFRGFQEAMDAENRIRNIQFAHGGHSAGVEVDVDAKRSAITNYIVKGDLGGLAVFASGNKVDPWLNVASNICWLVWLVLAGILLLLGKWARNWHTWAVIAYVVVLYGLLYSV
jgi:pimeloyl-ACP methyl ester carboxylesterase